MLGLGMIPTMFMLPSPQKRLTDAAEDDSCCILVPDPGGVADAGIETW